MSILEKLKTLIKDWFDKTEIETLTAIELIQVLDYHHDEETVPFSFGVTGDRMDIDGKVSATIWGGFDGDQIEGEYTFSLEQCLEYFKLLKSEIEIQITETEIEKTWDEYLKSL